MGKEVAPEGHKKKSPLATRPFCRDLRETDQVCDGSVCED